MKRHLVLLLGTLVFTSVLTAQTSGHSAAIGLDGIWSSATATPLERPKELAGKEFFTREEAAAWEKRFTADNNDPVKDTASTGVGTYNVAFREYGAKVVKTLRTSIIIDPPDGRLPALTPAAAARRRARIQALRHPSGPVDFGLQDRCLVFPTAIPPMIPYSYDSNYQFVGTGSAVMIHAEMVHDTRIIALDRKSHLRSSVRLWLGDSVGHREGATLVVDTTNFNDADGFYGDAGGNYGWDRNLHVVERFRLLDRDTILYQFDVEDPTAYTRPWKGELTLSRGSGPIYEYACHEGNYALPNLLSAFGLKPIGR